MSTKKPTPKWPRWEVGAIWKRKQGPWPGSDHLGPFVYQIYWPEQPTPEVITKEIRLPAGIEGTWQCCALAWVKKIWPADDEITEEAPTKN